MMVTSAFNFTVKERQKNINNEALYEEYTKVR